MVEVPTRLEPFKERFKAEHELLYGDLKSLKSLSSLTLNVILMLFVINIADSKSL
jgi:hypothetical protein